MTAVAHRTETTQATDVSAALHFAEKARELTEFCVRRGKTAFDGWDVRTLYRYVFFHVVTRTVFCVRSRGAIAAVAFVWGDTEKEIRRRAALGLPDFAWRKTHDGADALFVDHVIGTKAELPRLLRQARGRWPDIEKKKIFARLGPPGSELVELTAAVLQRMMAGE